MLLQVFLETKHRRETVDAILDLYCNCAYYWPILMSITAVVFIFKDQKRSAGCLVKTSCIAALWQNIACQVKNACCSFLNSISTNFKSSCCTIYVYCAALWQNIVRCLKIYCLHCSFYLKLLLLLLFSRILIIFSKKFLIFTISIVLLLTWHTIKPKNVFFGTDYTIWGLSAEN